MPVNGRHAVLQNPGTPRSCTGDFLAGWPLRRRSATPFRQHTRLSSGSGQPHRQSMRACRPSLFVVAQMPGPPRRSLHATPKAIDERFSVFADSSAGNLSARNGTVPRRNAPCAIEHGDLTEINGRGELAGYIQFAAIAEERTHEELCRGTRVHACTVAPEDSATDWRGHSLLLLCLTRANKRQAGGGLRQPVAALGSRWGSLPDRRVDDG